MSEPTWIKAGLTFEQFSALPPGERWALDRQHNPHPIVSPHPNRPIMRTLTAQELDSIKDLPFHERHTRGRELQQTPAPSQG